MWRNSRELGATSVRFKRLNRFHGSTVKFLTGKLSVSNFNANRWDMIECICLANGRRRPVPLCKHLFFFLKHSYGGATSVCFTICKYYHLSQWYYIVRDNTLKNINHHSSECYRRMVRNYFFFQQKIYANSENILIISSYTGPNTSETVFFFYLHFKCKCFDCLCA